MDIVQVALLTAVEGLTLHLFSGFVRGWPPVLLLFIAQYALLKFYRVFLFTKYLSPLWHLPGPKESNVFLFGQLLNLLASRPPEPYLSWSKRFPDAPMIRFLSVANKEVLLVNSVKAHRDILQTHRYKFVKPAFLSRILGDITGVGLLFAEGSVHKQQRRLIAGAFSLSKIKDLLPYFQAMAEELVAVMARKIEEDSSQPTEVSSLLARTTFDIIGLAVLNIHLNNLSNPTDFAIAYESIFDLDTRLKQLMMFLNGFIPIRRLLPIKVNRDYLRATELVQNRLRQPIRKRKLEDTDSEADKGEAKVGNSLLSLMIRERSQGSVEWTEDEILGHLLNFMAARHETIAGALTWSLYALANHLKIQDRLREEINGAVEPNEQPNYREIESLHYLGNFAKEILRFYPPAIVSHRESVEDAFVDGVLVSKGTEIHIVHAVPYFNDRIFGPKAEDFDPDRWDDLPESASDAYAFESFLAGPRVCIGRAFGLLEKCILIGLVRNFEFRGDGHIAQVQRGGPTLRPEGGMNLIVKRI